MSVVAAAQSTKPASEVRHRSNKNIASRVVMIEPLRIRSPELTPPVYGLVGSDG